MPCPPECQDQITKLQAQVTSLQTKLLKAIQDVPITVQMPKHPGQLTGRHNFLDFKQDFIDHCRTHGPIEGWAIITVVRVGAIDFSQVTNATVVTAWRRKSTINFPGVELEITFTYDGTTITYDSSMDGEHAFSVAFIPFTAGGGAVLAIP